MKASIIVDKKEFEKMKKNLFSVRGKIKSACTDWAYDTIAEIQAGLRGKILKRRTGELARRTQERIQETREGVKISFGSNLVYAAIHEFGGTIVPKKAKFLTIPFPGVYGKAKDFSNTFVAKGVIHQKIGNKDWNPLFSLKKSVTIPARHYLSEPIKKMRPELERGLKRAVESIGGK